MKALTHVKIQFLSRKEQSVTISKTSWWKLYREIWLFIVKSHTEYVNTVCRQHADLQTLNLVLYNYH